MRLASKSIGRSWCAIAVVALIVAAALNPTFAEDETSAPAAAAQATPGESQAPGPTSDESAPADVVPQATPDSAESEESAPAAARPLVTSEGYPAPAPTAVTAGQLFRSLPRFGADVFVAALAGQPPAASPGSPLANVPVSPNYRLGPADVFKVQIRNLDKTVSEKTITVTADGYITLPVLGKLMVSGQRLAETEGLITSQASEFYSAPEVIVELLRQRTIDVYVIGQVARPGKFSLPGEATIFTALYAAGGPSEVGSYRRIKVLREDGADKQIDMYDYLMYGRRDVDVMLQVGDTVFVPPLTAEIGIAGAVRRPARYEMIDEVSLEKALEIAGGLKPDAYATSIEVWRPDATEMWHLIRASATAAGAKGKDLTLTDGDLVRVGTLVDRALNTVELRGPVRRPGVYQVTPGLTAGGLLRLAQGPTEDTYMEQGAIWRLNNDLDYEQIPFSVRDSLSGAGDVQLQPHDIVNLYTERDVLSPAVVTIEGHVRKPGVFPFVEGATVRDLVMLAGSLLPGAYTRQAELFRITPEQSTMIVPVSLLKALEEGGAENLALRRGDVLRVLARADVSTPRQVRIDGYVRQPGSYERYVGMKVSDLIVAAGGLKPDAGVTIQYTPGRFQGASNTSKLSLRVTPEGFTVEPDVLLKDDDHIGILGRSHFTVVPQVAAIYGRVKRPGTYALRIEGGDDPNADTVYDLIQRADGLLEDANPKALILYRVYEEVLPEDRQEDLNYIISLLNTEGETTSLALTPEEESEIVAGSVGRQVGGLLGTDAGALLVVPPRRISIASWIKAVPVDGAMLLATSGKKGNLKLHHGDVLRVHKAVDFVTVIGSVNSPGAIALVPGEHPRQSVARAGGGLPDASLERMILLRSNGAAALVKPGDTLEAGDVVIVPSKHMFRTARIKTSWVDSLRQVISIAAAALVF